MALIAPAAIVNARMIAGRPLRRSLSFPSMLRQFLTVLALISGLAALAEPAQAARFASDIATSSETEQGPSGAIARPGLVGESIGGDFRRARAAKFCPRAVVTVIVPPVHLKADRARE